MKEFREIAKEMRRKLEQAISTGPVCELDERLNELLNDFESTLMCYADDEASKRAIQYYRSMEGLLDQDPRLDDEIS